MAVKRERGFVLINYPYRETSSIVVLLTEREGIKKGIAKGVKRKKTKMQELLSQFSEIEVNFYEGEKGELVTFTEAELIKSILPDLLDYPCPFILTYIAEILLQIVPEGQPNEKIFKLTKHILEGFSKKIEWQKLKVYFDYWILKLNGILPQKFSCNCKKNANYFNEKTFDFYCEEHNKNGLKFPEKLEIFLNELKKKDIFSAPPLTENYELYKFSNLIFSGLISNFLQREIKALNFLKTCDKLFIL